MAGVSLSLVSLSIEVVVVAEVSVSPASVSSVVSSELLVGFFRFPLPHGTN